MKKLFTILFFAFFSAYGFAQNIPELKERVTFAGSLQPSSAQKNQLASALKELDTQGKVEMVVLVVDSVKPMAIEQYGIKVAEKWKVGQKNVNNGLILIVATQDRKARMEVGRGLEGVLPDLATSNIQKEKMVPFFKKGDYVGGILAAINEVKVKSAKEIPVLTNQLEANKKTDSGFSVGLIFGVFAFLASIGAIIFFSIKNAMKNALKEKEDAEKRRKQWENEYKSSRQSYKPKTVPNAPPEDKLGRAKAAAAGAAVGYVASRTASKKSSSSSSDDSGYSPSYSSRSSDSSSSSSSDSSYSGGGGDFGGGGSSSDW